MQLSEWKGANIFFEEKIVWCMSSLWSNYYDHLKKGHHISDSGQLKHMGISFLDAWVNFYFFVTDNILLNFNLWTCSCFLQYCTLLLKKNY